MRRYQVLGARSRWGGAVSVALALGMSAISALIIASRAPAAPAPLAGSRTPPTAAAASARAALALPPAAPAPARAAHTASVDDTGHLRLLNASGSILNEAGPASGTLPGRVKVRLVVRAEVTASFTIETNGGSIVGHGSAVLHSSREYSSFGGSLSVDRGTGRYAHADGGGKLYGVIDRSSDALTVQTVGQLHY